MVFFLTELLEKIVPKKHSHEFLWKFPEMLGSPWDEGKIGHQNVLINLKTVDNCTAGSFFLFLFLFFPIIQWTGEVSVSS